MDKPEDLDEQRGIPPQSDEQNRPPDGGMGGPPLMPPGTGDFSSPLPPPPGLLPPPMMGPNRPNLPPPGMQPPHGMQPLPPPNMSQMAPPPNMQQMPPMNMQQMQPPPMPNMQQMPPPNMQQMQPPSHINPGQMHNMGQQMPPPPMGQPMQGPPMQGPPMNQPPQMPPNMGQMQPPPNMSQQMPPPPNMGQMQPPPNMGQMHPPPNMGQMQPPPNMGQMQPPPNMGQMQPPPNMGQQMPPNMGQQMPPNMGQQMPPPNMGQQMPPPNMGQQMPPPNMGQQMPPNMGQQMPPPNMGPMGQHPGQSPQHPPGNEPNLVPPGSEGDAPKEKDMEPVERPSRLPQALEKALAFKTKRAVELGVESENDITHEVEEETPSGTIQSALEDLEEYEDFDEKEEKDGKKSRKSKIRKKKKKKSKSTAKEPDASVNSSSDKENVTAKSVEPQLQIPEVEIEYVQEKFSVFDLGPQYQSFARIFEVFRMSEQQSNLDQKDINLLFGMDMGLGSSRAELTKVPKLPEDDDIDENEKIGEGEKVKLSKRKMKKLTRLSIAELKQLVSRPDVVEMHDVTARDPKLLVQLKAHRNTVPVPRHWCFKRKYLQGKRGIEKPPFDLPDFIKKTGIMEMRSALQDKEESKTLKAKMRERARPKMGKIDIDYQKLHDAFFKWQTKPRLTIHGDLYYEGKEYETRLKEKKPGELSSELRVALGMPVGAGANKVPPPWLIAMQRYGPPPSYPNLRIPGLNCPIPEGASFGYHAGGWGKPPVDETGKPLYGDVFATHLPQSDVAVEDEEVEKTVWGELESESEEESIDSEGEVDLGEDETGLATPGLEGLVTPSGIATVPTGIETPDIIELRKKKIEADMDGGDTPSLYQVLPEKRVDRVGSAMMASTHVYDLAAVASGTAVGGTTSTTARKDTVEVALDPSELDMDSDAMAARYEQQMKEQQSHLQKEDLSDMLADHVHRQKNKRKKQQQSQENKPSKKYKEFKF